MLPSGLLFQFSCGLLLNWNSGCRRLCSTQQASLTERAVKPGLLVTTENAFRCEWLTNWLSRRVAPSERGPPPRAGGLRMCTALPATWAAWCSAALPSVQAPETNNPSPQEPQRWFKVPRVCLPPVIRGVFPQPGFDFQWICRL